MILGIGVDLVALPALVEQVGLPGSTFLDSVLTARERRVVESRVRAEAGSVKDPRACAPHVGVRWAAKEAFVKAWSAALEGVAPPIPVEQFEWREVEVVQDHWGRPTLHLHGRVAQEVARTLALPGDRPPGSSSSSRSASSSCSGLRSIRWHVSLSHDGDLAVAAVVLERVRTDHADDIDDTDGIGAGGAGSLTGFPTGDLAGTQTGDLAGNLAGNLAGDLTAQMLPTGPVPG